MPNQKLTDAITSASSQWPPSRSPIKGGSPVRPGPGPVGPPVRVPPNPKPGPPVPPGPPVVVPPGGGPPPPDPDPGPVVPPGTPPGGDVPPVIVVPPVGPPPTTQPGDYPTFHPGVWSDAKLTVTHGEGKYTVLKVTTIRGVVRVEEKVLSFTEMNQDWLNSWLGDLRFADPINHKP